MDKTGNNYYQSCRLNAGLTQEAASEMIGISVSTIAKIETDARLPSELVVDRMADVYHAPMLAWWHLKHHSVLGHHLPDVIQPQSDGDMALQSILMGDDICHANEVIKALLADGIIALDEYEDLMAYNVMIKRISDRATSINVYIEGIDKGAYEYQELR